jgi:hypothetical protein
MKPTTILRTWWLIDFEHEGVGQGIRLAWGIVENDPSCRWCPGDYCCTSPVIQEKEEEGELYAITKSSTYQLTGPGERITMPANTILALRAGHSPPEILASKEMSKDRVKEGL